MGEWGSFHIQKNSPNGHSSKARYANDPRSLGGREGVGGVNIFLSDLNVYLVSDCWLDRPTGQTNLEQSWRTGPRIKKFVLFVCSEGTGGVDLSIT